VTTFIVYAGPNGSGKSSLRDVIDSPVEVVIDPDRIARQINAADPRSVDPEAGRAAVRLFDDTIAARQSLSMETTLSGHSALRRMERAKAAGYEVTLIYVALNDPQLNVDRVTERARQGGHFIEPGTVRRRVGSSLDNLPRALAIADQSVVLDNSGPAHRRVLEVADGRLTFQAEQLPRWLQDRLPAIETELRRDAADRPEAKPSPRAGLTGMLRNVQRPPDPARKLPWEPEPVRMAERVRAFEDQAAKAREAAAKPPEPAAESEGDAPKPRPGPRP
jgi:predicted ABC-type ATPase